MLIRFPFKPEIPDTILTSRKWGFVFNNEIDSLNIISWFDKIKKDNLQ